MAIVQNPITGRTTGKFATAVFSKQFGKNTMRSKPTSVANPRTQLQKEQRAKFALMVELSRMFLPFLKTSYKQAAVGMSEFNMFMKSNIKNVISGTFPDYEIDFQELQVAKGSLTGVDIATATVATGSKINLVWDDNTGVADAQDSDNVLALVINPDKGTAFSSLSEKTRVDGTLEVNLPVSWVGDSVYVYLAFTNSEHTKTSNSSFLNELVVIA